jgi:hypothetical protein
VTFPGGQFTQIATQKQSMTAGIAFPHSGLRLSRIGEVATDD